MNMYGQRKFPNYQRCFEFNLGTRSDWLTKVSGIEETFICLSEKVSIFYLYGKST